LVTIARKTFESLAEHGRSDIGFRSLEKADAVIIGIVDQPCEFLLTKSSLDLAVVRAGAEG
jgi:hypothetical protein